MPDQDRFPTRQYAYGAAASAAFGADQLRLAAGRCYRLLLGKDPEPVPLEPDAIKAELHDPFAELILAGSEPLPRTLRALLATFDVRNADPAGLPIQASFVVADGGQIPWSPLTAALQRQIRFVITRGKPSGSSAPELMISTSAAFDSPTTFLQVIGWDPVEKTYRFYDRRNSAWIYAGSSWDSLVPPTRGKGPFDSHVNGALNMKELKIPWQNWHSEAAGIKDDVLALDDPLRTEKLWTGRSPAQQFEISVIRPGIIRWMEARFAACVADGRLTRLPEFMRHMLETTTVNLISSVAENRQLANLASFKLPLTFFFNSDTLLNTLELEPDIVVPQMDAGLYRNCLTQFAVEVTDGNFRFPGDTHFVFLVPEPAFEDQTVINSLIASSAISRKLAACLLMVDFPNPVFSLQRAALMKHVPETAALGGAGDLPEFVIAVSEAAAALPPGSAEAEFLANWELPDTEWQRVFEKRIEDFIGKIAERLSSATGVQDIFRLAESRRREFRKRPLAEFRLTTPVTNLSESVALLQLTADGRVVEKTCSLEERDMNKFDPPGFLQDLDAAQSNAWSEWISTQFDEARQRNDPDIANYGPRLQFFNPLRNPPDNDAVERDVTWTAFPKIVRIQSVSDRQRWRHADSSRDVQDEYCEWSVTRDPQTEKITRVTFTSEGPEYWQFLASVNPSKVVELYREHVNPDVRPEHLFQNGTYLARNRWNNSTTNGAMHLIQRNNTLGAEIELAAAATIVRVVGGRTLDAEQELIECGSYGQPERNSDPHIGALVNELARAKADITLANPVGLCIAGLSVVGWRTPDDSPASDYWKIVRGTPEKALRAVYEVPPGKGFTVGDIEINGRKIEFASQIADFITIKLTGLATRLGKSTVAPFRGCVQSAGLATTSAQLSVAQALSRTPTSNRR